jgi:hypothetical protein
VSKESTTTALATRAPTAPEWAGPKEVELLGAFPESKFNLLVPTVAIRQINPYLVPDIEVVQLSTDEEGGDIYHDSQMKANHFAPTARALARLASVAGITQLDSRRMDDGKDPEIVEWRVEIEMTLPSGRVVRGFGSKRIDLNQLAKGWTPQRLAKAREHLVANAETKAFNRAIRSVLSLHGSFPKSQLAKPFAILRWVPNMADPDVQKAYLGQLAPASARLFGPTNGDVEHQEPLLIEQAPDDEATVDAETGEVIDEPDWSKTQQLTPGEQFVTKLREWTESSPAKGPATQKQRDALKELLRGLGQPNVMTVLGAAWDLNAPGDITGAQADAILSMAGEDKAFGETWAAAAGELAAATADGGVA